MEWLIEVTGLPFDILILVLLAVAGAFAGFVDSIVGGGGLISVPAMLLTNLPPSMALGSNKLSSIFGAGSASITFLRNHMVDFSLVRKLLPLYICMAFALGIGIYDGFIGPGTGTFLIMGFIFTGFDFLHASANAKILNFTSNLASLLVFLYLGHVNIKYGLATGAGQIIGAYLGSHLAIAKGSSLVRVVFLSVTTVMLLKLVYDYVSTL